MCGYITGVARLHSGRCVVTSVVINVYAAGVLCLTAAMRHFCPPRNGLTTTPANDLKNKRPDFLCVDITLLYQGQNTSLCGIQ